MNYLKQVNTFFELLIANPLSANAQCLYFNLLNINNRCNWSVEFTTANSTLMAFTGLNKQALYRARNELIQKELIEFKKGVNQNQSGKYKILEFVTANNTADDTPNDTPNNTADDTNNKQNKTKQKIKEKINKKEYGEFKNVKLTDEEFAKVKKMFPNDFSKRIQSLDDYIQSKGTKYKDFVATLRNWARKEGYKFPEEKKEYKEIKITEQEYHKRGKKYE